MERRRSRRGLRRLLSLEHVRSGDGKWLGGIRLPIQSGAAERVDPGPGILLSCGASKQSESCCSPHPARPCPDARGPSASGTEYSVPQYTESTILGREEARDQPSITRPSRRFLRGLLWRQLWLPLASEQAPLGDTTIEARMQRRSPISNLTVAPESTFWV